MTCFCFHCRDAIKRISATRLDLLYSALFNPVDAMALRKAIGRLCPHRIKDHPNVSFVHKYDRYTTNKKKYTAPVRPIRSTQNSLIRGFCNAATLKWIFLCMSYIFIILCLGTKKLCFCEFIVKLSDQKILPGIQTCTFENICFYIFVYTWVLTNRRFQFTLNQFFV